MDTELKHIRVSLIVHVAAAIGVAAVSFWLQNNLFAGVLGIAVLLIIGYPLERMAGKSGLKWWFANGIILYLFAWLVGWIYLFNMV